MAGIWTTMENQEPWEPTFPADYTLPPKNVYGGSGRGRQAPKPAYLSGRPAVNAATAGVSAALAAREEAAIRSSGVRGSSGSAGGGGGRWGRGRGGGEGSVVGEPRSAPTPWPRTTIKLMGSGAYSVTQE